MNGWIHSSKVYIWVSMDKKDNCFYSISPYHLPLLSHIHTYTHTHTHTTEHREKLHSTLRTFEAVDNKITGEQQIVFVFHSIHSPRAVTLESRDKIHRVKASLNQCKMSLRFKREELKRLWLEDIKYKNMLQTIQAM